ncbi:hypothetical protein [Dyella sp.]|uniref:hypothetical protein n=1 Tax=Dyella sp. TaxID=1869338 RepID=UPI002FDAFA5C
MNDKNVSQNDKITVIEEALLKHISGGAATKKGELAGRLLVVPECTGKGAE